MYGSVRKRVGRVYIILSFQYESVQIEMGGECYHTANRYFRKVSGRLGYNQKYL